MKSYVSVLLVEKLLRHVDELFLVVKVRFERRLLSCIRGTLFEGIHLWDMNSKGLAFVR